MQAGSILWDWPPGFAWLERFRGVCVCGVPCAQVNCYLQHHKLSKQRVCVYVCVCICVCAPCVPCA